MNITQQYGNSLMSPYGQQDYSNFFGSRGMAGNYNTTPVQGTGNNLIWVQGIEGAKAFMLQPNAKVIMLDSEIENRAYIKIADELGATKLRKFELTEIQEDEQPAKLSEYVRKDELQSLIMSILPQSNIQESEVIQDESTISTIKPIIKRTTN